MNPIRFRALLLLVVLPSAALAAGVPGTTPYSWRGDGQGVFPAQGLVTSFKGGADGKGPNIVWRTALPNWGGNAPIVVRDRVFVICQEGVDTECPQLLCLDVNTGKILWQRPVDHLDAWPEEKAKEAREIRRKDLAAWAKSMRWWNKLYWDNEKNTWKEGVTHPKGKPPEVIPPAQAALVAEAAKDGIDLPPTCGIGVSGGTRGRWHIRFAKDPAVAANFVRCIKENIYWYPGWSSEGPFWGSVMGSVVSDGQFVYAVTALDGAACYDLDGNRRWVSDLASVWVRMRSTNCDLGSDQGGRYQQNMASPVLADGKLVYYHRDAAMMYALDCATGKTAWKTPAPRESKPRDGFSIPVGYQGHMAPGGTPVVMELGKTLVVVSGHGMVVRVADGKCLGMVSVPNTNETESASSDEPPTLDGSPEPPAVHRNADAEVFGSTYSSWVADKDVIFAASEKRGMGAVRLRLDGDKLVSEPVWVEKGFNNMEGPNLAVFEGRLYGVSVKKRGFAEIDPATGRVGATTAAPAGWCTGWVISRDGVAVYKGGKSGFLICQLPGMKPLGEGALDDTPTPEQKERNIAQLGFAVVNGGPAGITAFGNRIFYRSNHYLWCVGDPGVNWKPAESSMK